MARPAPRRRVHPLVAGLTRHRRAARPRVSQTEMARRLGLSLTAVGNLELGVSVPRLPMLEDYARALGLRVVIHLVPDTPRTEGGPS